MDFVLRWCVGRRKRLWRSGLIAVRGVYCAAAVVAGAELHKRALRIFANLLWTANATADIALSSLPISCVQALGRSGIKHSLWTGTLQLRNRPGPAHGCAAALLPVLEKLCSVKQAQKRTKGRKTLSAALGDFERLATSRPVVSQSSQAHMGFANDQGLPAAVTPRATRKIHGSSDPCVLVCAYQVTPHMP